MTTTLTRNLKLRIDSNLTANAKYNLERLDTLGASLLVDSTERLNIRAASDITIEPESTESGGSGSGGSLSIGLSDHILEEINLYSSLVNVSGLLGLLDQASSGTKHLQVRYKSDLNGLLDNSADRVLSLDLDGADRSLILGGNLSLGSNFTLGGGSLNLSLAGATSWSIPTNSSGYLSNDGSGNLTWTSITGGGDVLGNAANWLAADGTTKSVTHGLNSTDVEVTVLDENDELILVDSIISTSSNTISLTASEAPSSSWRVVVHAK